MATSMISQHRHWIFFFGSLMLAITWLGPLPELASQYFAAHMAMHVLVVAIVPALLALAVTGSRWDLSITLPTVFTPLPAAIVELAVIWAWHTPTLHYAARTDSMALMLEQACFILVGLLVWLSALGGDTRQKTTRAAAGIIGLLLTSMHMTLLGTLLSLSPRPLYHDTLATTAMLTPLEDLHLGGVLMLIGGGLTYLIGGLYLLAGILRNNKARSLS